MPSPVSEVARTAGSRLRFPQLFGVLLALFLFDLFFPDFVPLVDEILLGLGAALFGLWRAPAAAPPPAAAPAEKNVTPPG